MSTDKRTGTLYCDFCGKSQHEVEVTIRGPSVEICDECVVLAQQKVDEVRAERIGPVATDTERGEGDGGRHGKG